MVLVGSGISTCYVCMYTLTRGARYTYLSVICRHVDIRMGIWGKCDGMQRLCRWWDLGGVAVKVGGGYVTEVE